MPAPPSRSRQRSDKNTQATATNAVALGFGSVANTAQTVSVGDTGFLRRIVNAAPGINPTDVATVSQVPAGVNTFGLPPPVATGIASTAVSVGSQATGDYAFAAGQSSIASGNFPTAVGQSATASGNEAPPFRPDPTASWPG